MTISSVVIVGAGAAGLSTADALRRRGFHGALTVIGEEHGAPYDRPPLSKQVLSGEWLPDRATLMPAHRLNEIDARLRLGVCATALDVATTTVTTDDDDSVSADAVVIATGVRPRLLPDFDLPGVFVLRTMADSLALRERIAAKTRLLVVGSGFLGLEVAATARKLGAEVTVVEPLEDPMVARLGQITAARLLALHASHGVTIRTGIGVSRAIGEAHVEGVELTDGEVLGADIVLVAVGCVPNVEWLAGSGLALDNGVICDEFSAAAEGVWAAGDVACWRHNGVQRDLRLEHRQNASEQARCVAKNILGEHEVYTPVPFFWTDHYDAKIQLAGTMPVGATETLAESDDERNQFVVTFHEGEALVGVLGWNAAQRLGDYRRRLAESAAST